MPDQVLFPNYKRFYPKMQNDYSPHSKSFSSYIFNNFFLAYFLFSAIIFTRKLCFYAHVPEHVQPLMQMQNPDVNCNISAPAPPDPHRRKDRKLMKITEFGNRCARPVFRRP
ncbi:MAG: hypothetical protein K2N63_10680, partial [Lachnospiraceae bacterium]|nr:hypothetical protein [Lachnospiraceae bacterium]